MTIVYSSMAEDLERFKLPMKWKPGSDLMSKNAVKRSKNNTYNYSLSPWQYIDICVDVSPDSYSVAPTEWADVQDQVNQEFMLKLISYVSNVYKRYKEISVVLVIVSKSSSSAKFQEEFTVSADGLLLETVCNFWANKYFFLTADAVSNHFQRATLSPMAALGFFITRHTMRQVPQQHWRDPTLALVSRIADNVLAKKDNDILLKSNTRCFLRNAKRNQEEIIEDGKNQETSGKGKTIIDAGEGLFAIEQFEKDLGDDKPTQYTTEDAEFIETLSKPGKRRKWERDFCER
ncbi:hypothetical protein MFLAVUS_007752 [Mucor flavus]|uniref:Uncharacterized protein n=1 Tax=Mucor flavus TaxID=439312 RepID=A0ABP9Z565_9FUNG